MLKVIISKDGFNLSIEKSEKSEKSKLEKSVESGEKKGGKSVESYDNSVNSVKLCIFEEDNSGGYGIEVDLDELYKAIGFVMGDYDPKKDTKKLLTDPYRSDLD